MLFDFITGTNGEIVTFTRSWSRGGLIRSQKSFKEVKFLLKRLKIFVGRYVQDVIIWGDGTCGR